MFSSPRAGFLSTSKHVLITPRIPLSCRAAALSTTITPSRRGGSNLSERFSQKPHLAQSEASFTDPRETALSAPGLANKDTQEAASRLARENEEYSLVGGVRIPKKPKAPGSDECCMSGCAVCIYDLYLESKASYSEALLKALDELEKRKVNRSLWPNEVIALWNKQNGTKDGLSVDGMVREKDVDEDPLDATMQAFLELEKRLKTKA